MKDEFVYMQDGASSHTGACSMGYLYLTIHKNRLIGLRKGKAWQEPGVVEHAPKSPDENVCDYFSKFYIGWLENSVIEIGKAT